jgi:hypothetical protein
MLPADGHGEWSACKLMNWPGWQRV